MMVCLRVLGSEAFCQGAHTCDLWAAGTSMCFSLGLAQAVLELHHRLLRSHRTAYSGIQPLFLLHMNST